MVIKGVFTDRPNETIEDLPENAKFLAVFPNAENTVRREWVVVYWLDFEAETGEGEECVEKDN